MGGVKKRRQTAHIHTDIYIHREREEKRERASESEREREEEKGERERDRHTQQAMKKKIFFLASRCSALLQCITTVPHLLHTYY